MIVHRTVTGLFITTWHRCPPPSQCTTKALKWCSCKADPRRNTDIRFLCMLATVASSSSYELDKSRGIRILLLWQGVIRKDAAQTDHAKYIVVTGPVAVRSPGVGNHCSTQPSKRKDFKRISVVESINIIKMSAATNSTKCTAGSLRGVFAHKLLLPVLQLYTALHTQIYLYCACLHLSISNDRTLRQSDIII